jgi:hypothetical protein
MIDPTIATFAVAAFALGAISLPVVALSHWTLRRLGGRRNATNRCAQCGAEWTEGATDIGDAHLVEGLLVCRACASRLRTRTRWTQLAVAGVIGCLTIATWGTAIGVYAEYGRLISTLKLVLLTLPPLAVTGAAAGYLSRMRRQNQLALMELARVRLFGESLGASRSLGSTSSEHEQPGS